MLVSKWLLPFLGSLHWAESAVLPFDKPLEGNVPSTEGLVANRI